jgi:hypothetical protein
MKHKAPQKRQTKNMKHIWQRGWYNDEHLGYWIVVSVDGWYHRRGGETTRNKNRATGYLEKQHASAACRLLNKSALREAWEPVLIDDAP